MPSELEIGNPLALRAIHSAFEEVYEKVVGPSTWDAGHLNQKVDEVCAALGIQLSRQASAAAKAPAIAPLHGPNTAPAVGRSERFRARRTKRAPTKAPSYTRAPANDTAAHSNLREHGTGRLPDSFAPSQTPAPEIEATGDPKLREQGRGRASDSFEDGIDEDDDFFNLAARPLRVSKSAPNASTAITVMETLAAMPADAPSRVASMKAPTPVSGTEDAALQEGIHRPEEEVIEWVPEPSRPVKRIKVRHSGSTDTLTPAAANVMRPPSMPSGEGPSRLKMLTSTMSKTPASTMPNAPAPAHTVPNMSAPVANTPAPSLSQGQKAFTLSKGQTTPRTSKTQTVNGPQARSQPPSPLQPIAGSAAAFPRGMRPRLSSGKFSSKSELNPSTLRSVKNSAGPAMARWKMNEFQPNSRARAKAAGRSSSAPGARPPEYSGGVGEVIFHRLRPTAPSRPNVNLLHLWDMHWQISREPVPPRRHGGSFLTRNARKVKQIQRRKKNEINDYR